MAIMAGSLSSSAIAGGLAASDGRPPLGESTCEVAGQDVEPPAGCARIRGYITAGDRFGFGERIGGGADLFAPLEQPGTAGARSSFGVTIIGAPLGGNPVLPPSTAGDEAR
jgi:hypothetical protein